MPIIPKIKVQILPRCNLRQALQWLTDEIKPVPANLETVLGIPNYIRPGLEKERSTLFTAFLGRRIRLFGRPGEGEMRVYAPDISSYDIYFENYGEYEEITVSQIAEAGLDGLNVDRSRISKVTKESDLFMPLVGWEYSTVVMPTEELLQTFPSTAALEDPSFEPQPIDLTDTSGACSAWPPSPQAESVAKAVDSVLLARTKVMSPNGNRIAPEAVIAGGERDGSIETCYTALPPYLQYAVWVFRQLGPAEIASRKKSDLEVEIKKRWWEALGQPSCALVGYMATMLRTLEAKQGGAKPRGKPASRI